MLQVDNGKLSHKAYDDLKMPSGVDVSTDAYDNRYCRHNRQGPEDDLHQDNEPFQLFATNDE